MSVVVNGQLVGVPGILTRSWREEPRLSLVGKDVRRRKTPWVRSVVLHTTKGIPGGKDRRPQKILPGIGPNTDVEERIARLWSTDPEGAGAHLSVDHDGSVGCHADLQLDATSHASLMNDVSIGIEIYQGANAEMYVEQLNVVVQLVDWLTRRFQIQRQFPVLYSGHAVERLEAGGKDCVGVFGHRDCSNNRGAGDPGDEIFAMFKRASYEAWDFEHEQDRNIWRARQRQHGVTPADGIPGGQTVLALQTVGRVGGLWVARPGD